MDIGVELIQKVTESFQRAYNEDVSIKVLEKRLRANKAHYEDAARYSERVGELLSEAYREVVSAEALPGGVMTWEIAQEVIQKPLIENYKRAATASVEYIAAENKRRGIGLKAQWPSPDFERLDGIKRKLVDAERFDDVAFMLDKPVVNFTRAVLDDAVEVNADFQAKAGLDVKIVRTPMGRFTCDWCKSVAGTYDYEDVRHGHDVWKRHTDCDCKIEHVSVKGREVVNNYKKSVTALENSEKINKRKAIKPPDDRAPEKIEARKNVNGIVDSVKRIERKIKNERWFKVEKRDGKTYDANDAIDLRGCDLQSAKSIYDGLKAVFDKVPILKGRLESFRVAALEQGTYAQFSDGKGYSGVIFNLMYYQDFEFLSKNYDDNVLANWHPKGTDASDIVAHEVAHAIDDYLTFNCAMGGVKKDGTIKCVSEYIVMEAVEKLDVYFDDVLRDVSEYAVTNEAEFLAECFAQWIGSSKPSEIATEVSLRLIELLEEGVRNAET